MSYETVLLPNFSPDGTIILAKEQFYNSYNFWAMPILIFSPFAYFGKQSLVAEKKDCCHVIVKVSFPPTIWIFMEGEGDGIKSRQPSERDRNFTKQILKKIKFFVRNVFFYLPVLAECSHRRPIMYYSLEHTRYWICQNPLEYTYWDS